MSYRYTWAVDGRTGRRGRAAERLAWSLGQSAPPEAGEVPPVPSDGDDGGGFDELVALAPAVDDALWQPVGPSTTIRGFVDSDVRVAGRVNDLALSPDGTRAYAASALGGLWYSSDSGVTWEPVGAWRTSNRATVTSGSNALTAGAVHVNWGANEGADEVWLGTGEALPTGRRDVGFQGNYGGIGVLSAVGPVAAVRPPIRWQIRGAWRRPRSGPPLGGYRPTPA